MGRQSLGRHFGWLWAAYAVSTFGTWFAFDAFPLIAILVLHAGPAAVSALAAAGLAVGAAVAVPLGPWVEFRRKRPVMVAMDLTRFAARAERPGRVRAGPAQLRPAARRRGRRRRGRHRVQGGRRRLPQGARPAGDLLVANARFESTTWTATALGPPLGGAAIGLLGPVTTVSPTPSASCSRPRASARSAAPSRGRGGTAASAAARRRPARRLAAHADQPGAAPAVRQHGPRQRPDPGDSAAGRRAHARRARLRALAVRHGLRRALRRRLGRLPAGPARWPPGSARTPSCARPARCARAGRSDSPSSGPGPPAWCSSSSSNSASSPAWACSTRSSPRYRLEHTEPDRVARTLAAWSVSSNATVAALTALWGAAGRRSPARAPRSRPPAC